MQARRRRLRRRRPTVSRLPAKRELTAQLLLVVLTAAVFSQSCTFPLLEGWDDNYHVANNAANLTFTLGNVIHWFTHSCVYCYLPLTMVSYMVDYAIWGLSGFGYHLQNVFWHVLAVLALYNILRFFRVSPGIACFFAAVFAVHPQRVESVVWISERKDVMCAAFYFWSIFVYVSRHGSRQGLVGSLCLFVLAMLSKSMAISLPVVLVLYDVYRAQEVNAKALLAKFWPFFLIAVLFVPVTIACQDQAKNVTTLSRQLFVVAHNIPWYLGKTFVPRSLSPIYPLASPERHVLVKAALFYALVVVGAGLLLARNRKLFWRVALIGVCFLAAIAPVLGFFHLGAIDYADRYSYIPSAFILFGVAVFLSEQLRKREATGIIAAGGDESTISKTGVSRVLVGCCLLFFVIVLSLSSFFYAQAWRDIHALHRMARLHAPPNHSALWTLGLIELERGDSERALEAADVLWDLKQVWMPGSTIVNNRMKATYLRAFALYHRNRRAEALTLLEQIRPYFAPESFHDEANYTKMLALMADCCLAAGAVEKARDCYDEILSYVAPGGREASFYRGVRAFHDGRYAEALEHLRQAGAADPANQQVLLNIRECERRLKRQ